MVNDANSTQPQDCIKPGDAHIWRTINLPWWGPDYCDWRSPSFVNIFNSGAISAYASYLSNHNGGYITGTPIISFWLEIFLMNGDHPVPTPFPLRLQLRTLPRSGGYHDDSDVQASADHPEIAPFLVQCTHAIAVQHIQETGV